jgi:hypothetical protein
MLLACSKKKRDKEAIFRTVRHETRRCCFCDCGPDPNPYVRERRAYLRDKRDRRRIGEIMGCLAFRIPFVELKRSHGP